MDTSFYNKIHWIYNMDHMYISGIEASSVTPGKQSIV